MKKRIITIGREFCSGGADIGHLVADRFEIPCYDKSIIDKTAEELQVNAELVKKYDERPNSIWENVPGYQYGYSWYAGDPGLVQPLNMRIAEAQFSAIRRFAEEGPCVIIGRCADYVLRDRDDVISVFIRASLDLRVARAQRLYGATANEARKLIKRTDKIRSSYYEAHTDLEWGQGSNFDLVIDSGRLGVSAVVEVITAAVQCLENQKRGIL